MLYGVGVDILHINRIKALSSDYDDSFFQKTFTEKEREQALARPAPYLGFCTKFSAKEAVLKALSIYRDPNLVRFCLSLRQRNEQF